MIKNKLNRSRGFGKVSKKMAEMPIIKVTCGSVKGKLHKNKFYCPGIHRECIEYQGRFITPKMFSVMGDKERLKDWKNAIRINGIQVRKYIESGALDFNSHDQFCTGRCIARSPVNRGSGIVSASTSAVVPKVEFVSSINEHTYCHLPDDSEHLLPNIPTVEMKGEPEPVDVKPNVALLQSLLEKPPANTVDVLPPDVAAALAADKDLDCEPISVDTATAEEDQQFWVGIMELGLLEHFFREIKINLDVYKSDLVTHQVRVNDAVRISSVVRSMGLMNKFKKRLASFKSDMDQQQAKIDAEMEALKQRVTQYELRKQALKRKSEKFELLMDMSANKKAFIIEKNVDMSDEDGDDDEKSQGAKEVVDVCYENDDEEEDDDYDDNTDNGDEEVDMETQSACVDRHDTGEKWVSVPRAVSPVRITTLPSDSHNSYVIKNNSKPETKTNDHDPMKKVTIIRQVLMDTRNDGDTMEKLKEAAVLKLKQSMAVKQNEAASAPPVVKQRTEPVPILPVGGFPSAKIPVLAGTSKLRPIAPAKEKIKIIARCKPVGDKNVSKATVPVASTGQTSLTPKPVLLTSSGNKPTNIVLQGTQVKTLMPKVSMPLSLPKPAKLTYNPNSNSLVTAMTNSSSVATVVGSTPKRDDQGSQDAGSPSRIPKSESPITKDLKVVVQPIEMKKRKPGPRSKTNYVELYPSPPKEQRDSSEEASLKDTTENTTPVDGGRENTQISDSLSRTAVSARRSSRKTVHMFSWGMKSGAEMIEVQDHIPENPDSKEPEKVGEFQEAVGELEDTVDEDVCDSEVSQTSDTVEVKDEVTWDVMV